jgi:hypothetical protein
VLSVGEKKLERRVALPVQAAEDKDGRLMGQ